MKRNPLYVAIRRNALMSAGALAIGAGGAFTAISFAQAADVDFSINDLVATGPGAVGTATVSAGTEGSIANQDNSSGSLIVGIDDTTVTTTNTVSGTNEDFDTEVGSNLISASGTGNLASLGIDAGDLTTVTSNEGANLIGQRNVSVELASTATNNTLGASTPTALTGPQSIDSDVQNNAVMASLSLNNAESSIDGTLYGSFAPTGAAASITDTLDTTASPELSSDVSANLSNVTSSSNVDVTGDMAEATGNTISSLIRSTGGDLELISSPTVDNNQVRADLSGNANISTILLDGGVSSTESSALVSTSQANLNTTGAMSLSALTDDSTISNIVRSLDGAGASVTLTGTLSTSENTVASTATGNTTLASDTDGAGNFVEVRAGNQISIEDINLAGTINAAAAADGRVSASSDGAGEIFARGDLVTSNRQSNLNEGAAGFEVSATTSDTIVRGIGENVDGGSVLVEDNRVIANAAGNQGENLIEVAGGNSIGALGGSGGIDNSVATTSLNVQDNSGVAISALVENTRIDARAEPELSLPNNIGGLSNGSIRADGNILSASASGSSAASATLLDANTVVSGTDATDFNGANIGSVDRSGTEVVAEIRGGGADGQVGSSFLNVQNFSDSSVDAQVTNSGASGINVYVDRDGDVANSDFTASASENVVSAQAVGNALSPLGSGINAMETIEATGNNVTGSFASTSAQTFDGDSGARASIADQPISVIVGSSDTITGSTLAAVDNILTAGITGNTASQSIALDAGSSLVLAAAESDAVGLPVLQTDANGETRARSAAAITNDQLLSTGDGSAGQLFYSDVTNTTIEVENLAALDGTTRDVDGNQLAASAEGNVANSVIDLSANSISSIDTDAGSLAGITSSQQATLDTNIEAEVTGSDLRVGEVGSALAISNAASSASGNTLSGSASGNDARNIITAEADSGLDLSGSVNLTSSSIDIDAASPGTSTVLSNFGIANTQTLGTVGTEDVYADVDNNQVRVFAGNADNAPLSADNNTVAGEALGQSAVNYITLSGGDTATTTNLTSSAAIANRQVVDADGVISSLDNNDVLIAVDGTLTDSATSVSGNTLDSLARVNDSLNQIDALTSGDVTTGDGSGASATLDVTGAIDSDAGLQIGGRQISDAWAEADITGTELTVTATGDATGSAVTLADNTLDASATGNRQINNLILEVDDFTGTAAISGAQSATNATNPAANAAISAIDIGADLENLTSSPVNVSDNTLTAGAFGNEQFSTTAVTAGSDITGENTSGLIDLSTVGEVTANGDLLSISLQNVDEVTASVDDVDITASATAVSSSGLTLDTNEVLATARGNNLENVVDLEAGSDILDLASVNFAFQGDDVNSTATVSNVAIATNVASLNSSPVSVSGNEVDALAAGNRAINQVTGAADGNITGANAAAGLDSTADTLTGDVLVNLFQDANETTADIDNITLTGSATGAATSSGLTLDDNSVVATARGNDATNLTDLAGSDVTTTAATVVGQESELAEASVDAVIISSGAASLTSSPISVSDNTVSASAAGNRLANQLSATASGNLTSAGSGVSSSGIGLGTTDADFFVQSDQDSDTVTATLNNANLNASGGTAATDSGLSIDRNTLSAVASGSSVVNTEALAGNSIEDASGAVLSYQESLSTSATADDLNAVVSATELGNSPASVSENVLRAQATSNRSDNAATVTSAGLLTGTNVIASEGFAWGVPSSTVSADYVVSSSQQAVDTSASLGATAGVTVGVGTDEATGSAINVNANLLAAQASGNIGNNSLALEANSIGVDSTATLDAAAGLVAGRQYTAGNTTSVVGATSTSIQLGTQVTANGLTGSPVSISDNLVFASSTANDLGNELSVTAGSGLEGAASLAANAQASNASDDLSIDADYGVGGFQLNDGIVTATLNAADVQADITGNVDSAVTLERNYLGAESLAANMVNRLTIDANSVSATAALQGVQGNTGTVTSTVGQDGGDVVTLASVINGDVTGATSIQDNTVNALARGSVQDNRLSVTANSVDSAANALGTSTGTADDINATADYLVTSAQYNEFGADVSGFNYGTQIGLDVTGSIDGAGVDVSGNAILSTARINGVTNVLNLDAGSGLGGASNGVSAAISNWQANEAAATALTQNAGIGALVSGDVDDAGMRVENNTISARASANSATNDFTAQGNAITANTAGANPVGSANGATVSAEAQFAVLNRQENTGNVSATVQSTGGADSGMRIESLGALNGGSMSVSNNRILAVASGNSATNRMGVSANSGAAESLSIASSQTNNGNAISASINGMQATVETGAVTASTRANGNTISASATGNSAVNRISSTNRSFSRLGNF